mgnify:CR=1 FL=1
MTARWVWGGPCEDALIGEDVPGHPWFKGRGRGEGVSDETPDVSMFRYHRGGSPKWRRFVEDMQPNIPVKTDMPPSGSASRELIKRHARDVGKQPVRFRTVDGVVWACWVVDDEVKA